MPEIRVFQLAEVAKLLEMPNSRVKNWTIGRPFRITPSVRVAKGTGSANLYSVHDVYLMAIANQLSVDGLATEIIERTMKKLKPDVELLGTQYTKLVIHGSGRKREIKLLGGRLSEGLSLRLATEAGELSRYTLDLRGLRKRVDEQVAKLLNEDPA